MGKRTEKGAGQRRGAARAAPPRRAANTQGEGIIGLGIRALMVALLLPVVLIPVGRLVRPWVMSSPWAQRLMSKPSAPTAAPVQREMRFPTVPFQLPRLRHLPEVPTNKADEAKLAAVKEAFTESWAAYEQHAWGYDEYHPLSKHGSNLLGVEGGAGSIGYTIVDALDMLILVGDEAGYRRARDYVRDKLDWNVRGRLNVFETTIRVLGGLLSASALMHDPPAGTLPASEADSRMFLEKATALAERLLPAFSTPSGVPLREVDLATGEAFPDMDNRNASSLAEATTVQLEFKYLAHRTGDRRFWTVAERPMLHARVAEKAPNMGLLPIFMDSRSGQFFVTDVRLGSRGDSYYEYLVKQYIQTNRTEEVYHNMYTHAFDGIKSVLLGIGTRTSPPLVYTNELVPVRAADQPGGIGWQKLAKQDHLVCFLGGTMMLGAAASGNRDSLTPPQRDATLLEDWRVGHELTRTCVNTYTSAATGLAPEIAFFRPPNDTRDLGTAREWVVKRTNPGSKEPAIDARNILRPETVESLYVAFQLTGDEVYRRWGWQIFEAFRRHCRVDGGKGGYAGIVDVDAETPQQIDRMETFWLSETLKYLYLLFARRRMVPLDRWVFNTEAHPLPVFTPQFPTGVP